MVRQFEHGQKAPNNGIYVEIGETGSMVKNPKSVKLKAGDPFPESTNDDRKWTFKPKPKEFG
ncbi:YjzC family protein [bacterium LRH843]|nr:YjzC family protein [bacterium LRH843]